MYTEQLTQGLNLRSPIAAQQLTATTTVTTGQVDLSLNQRAIFIFFTGTWGGTSPTLSAVGTLQDSPDGTTWTNTAGAPTFTVNAQNTGGTAELRAGQLNAGAKFVRLSVVCTIGGTSPTIPVAGMAIGGEAQHKPASANNNTTTWPTANQVVT